jgi:hypothetical protein
MSEPTELTEAVSRMRKNDRERFFAKVSPPNQDGCMLWTSSTSKDGYGRFLLFKKVRKAHRVAYELLVGPIEEGMEIDHVRERGCRSRACVNPDHLEPTTRAVNNTRGGSPTAKNARKTKCIRGHLFTVENTVVDHLGGRHCKECVRQRSRAAALRTTTSEHKGDSR